MYACMPYNVTQKITSFKMTSSGGKGEERGIGTGRGKNVSGGGGGAMSLKSGSTHNFPLVKWTFFCCCCCFWQALKKHSTKNKQTDRKQRNNWTIHHNLYIARDHGAQVCLPGCIQITCGRILALFLLYRGSFTNNSQLARRWASDAIVCY